jgi:hypothetical protein
MGQRYTFILPPLSYLAIFEVEKSFDLNLNGVQ